jgi:hypothetical protein
LSTENVCRHFPNKPEGNPKGSKSSSKNFKNIIHNFGGSYRFLFIRRAGGNKNKDDE